MLAKKDGHQIEYLTCDADFPTCYNHELRDIRPKWQECLMCRVGGVRSYDSANVSSIGANSCAPVNLPNFSKDWALSSASSIGRFESESDFASSDFSRLVERLRPAVEKAYVAASNWISQRNLDAVVVFNGRIDATRAIFEAAKSKGVSVATLERTWFGDGLQILPGENCLGLHSVDRLVSYWSAKPLTPRQAFKAAALIASRFLRRNQNEWRAYNLNASVEPWPANGRRKILLVPGSLNEIWGHSQWGSNWAHPLEAYDALIDHFALRSNDLVLRAHPNWGEKIGKNDGHLAEGYYTHWARKRGVLVIPSTSNVSTLGLIEQADAIVVASGSAALEASALGKQVIGIAGSNYQEAGIHEAACSDAQLKVLKLRIDMPGAVQDKIAALVRRNCLRFAYTISHRVAQYVDYVKCVTPVQFKYKPGADSKRLIAILRTGELVADDEEWIEGEEGETPILDLLCQKRWMDLIVDRKSSVHFKSIRRRFPFSGLDTLRGMMPMGDR
jgi:ADP-heptose:LPS heptosyltransferase